MTSRFRRLSLLALIPAIALAGSCENSVSIVPDVLAGSYTAISFIVTQSGQAPVDVLASGGSLTITIAGDSTTTGAFTLPAGVLGSTGGTASMAGKIVQQSDGTFRFNQTENTFIAQLVWQKFTDALVSTTFLSNTQFQITLKK